MQQVDHVMTSFSVAIGMKQTKILCGQLNCWVKLAYVSTRTERPSRNVGKFYRTVKLSAKNLRLFHVGVLTKIWRLSIELQNGMVGSQPW